MDIGFTGFITPGVEMDMLGPILVVVVFFCLALPVVGLPLAVLFNLLKYGTWHPYG